MGYHSRQEMLQPHDLALPFAVQAPKLSTRILCNLFIRNLLDPSIYWVSCKSMDGDNTSISNKLC